MSLQYTDLQARESAKQPGPGGPVTSLQEKEGDAVERSVADDAVRNAHVRLRRQHTNVVPSRSVSMYVAPVQEDDNEDDHLFLELSDLAAIEEEIQNCADRLVEEVIEASLAQIYAEDHMSAPERSAAVVGPLPVDEHVSPTKSVIIYVQNKSSVPMCTV